MKTGRPKKEEKDKKKKVSFTLNEDVYDMWMEYCKKNNIENQSEFIENIIRKNNKNI